MRGTSKIDYVWGIAFSSIEFCKNFNKGSVVLVSGS